MTPEEWLHQNLPPSENLQSSTLHHNGVLLSKGRVYVDIVNRLGVFLSDDGKKLELPIPEAILMIDGKCTLIRDVERCTSLMSEHLHFSLK